MAEIPDRNLGLDLARVTETAAMAAARWQGRGDKEAADQAAVDGMRAHLAGAKSSSGDGGRQTAPFFVESEAAVGPPPSPQPDLGRLRLRNRHLEYAMTWWGLSLTLIGVYLGFANVRLRRLESPS